VLCVLGWAVEVEWQQAQWLQVGVPPLTAPYKAYAAAPERQRAGGPGAHVELTLRSTWAAAPQAVKLLDEYIPEPPNKQPGFAAAPAAEPAQPPVTYYQGDVLSAQVGESAHGAQPHRPPHGCQDLPARSCPGLRSAGSPRPWACPQA
jgi:hypothetical protein